MRVAIGLLSGCCRVAIGLRCGFARRPTARGGAQLPIGGLRSSRLCAAPRLQLTRAVGLQLMSQAGPRFGLDDAEAEAEAEAMLRDALSLGAPLAALDLARLLLQRARSRARSAASAAEAAADGAEAAQLLEAVIQPGAIGISASHRALAAYALLEACWRSARPDAGAERR